MTAHLHEGSGRILLGYSADDRVAMLQLIMFQHVGFLDFNWSPLHARIQLNTCILNASVGVSVSAEAVLV